jgi:hypothetical protein
MCRKALLEKRLIEMMIAKAAWAGKVLTVGEAAKAVNKLRANGYAPGQSFEATA